MEWKRKQNHRLNNLPKVKIFSTLQVHHLILAFIIHNHKYIHVFYIMNCSKKGIVLVNFINDDTSYNATINISYKLLVI